MKISKIFTALSIFALTFAATSCLGDTEQTSTQSITATCRNSITYGDGTSTLSSANYVFAFDFNNATVDVTTFDSNINSVSYKIKGLTLRMNSSLGYIFSATAPTVTNGQDQAISGLTITNFYGQYTGTTVKVQYVVNGTTTVYATYAATTGDVYAYSTTTTSLPDGSSSFQWTEATYTLLYNLSESTVKLTISNIKFAEAMPITLSEMVVENIPFTVTASGINISAESAIPKISDVEYPAYTLTNISGTISPNFSTSTYFNTECFDMKFTCMGYNAVVKAYVFEQQ